MKAVFKFLLVAAIIFLISLFLLSSLHFLRSLVFAYTASQIHNVQTSSLMERALCACLIPSILFTALSATIYYGRHRISALGARLVFFILIAGLTYGGFILIPLIFNTEPPQNEKRIAREQGINGEILDFGSSALICIDGGLVEAQRTKELTFIPLSSQALLSINARPYSEFEEALRIKEPFSSLAKDIEKRNGRFSSSREKSSLAFIIYIFAFSLLLLSFMGLAYLSPWPLANTITGLLLFRLFLYVEPLFLYKPYLEFLSRLLPRLPKDYYLVFTYGALALVFILLNGLFRLIRGRAYV